MQSKPDDDDEQVDVTMQFLSNFSSWTHLRRMVSWLLRFKTLLAELARQRRQLRAVFGDSSSDKERLEARIRRRDAEGQNAVSTRASFG